MQGDARRKNSRTDVETVSVWVTRAGAASRAPTGAKPIAAEDMAGGFGTRYCGGRVDCFAIV